GGYWAGGRIWFCSDECFQEKLRLFYCPHEESDITKQKFLKDGIKHIKKTYADVIKRGATADEIWNQTPEGSRLQQECDEWHELQESQAWADARVDFNYALQDAKDEDDKRIEKERREQERLEEQEARAMQRELDREERERRQAEEWDRREQ